MCPLILQIVVFLHFCSTNSTTNLLVASRGWTGAVGSSTFFKVMMSMFSFGAFAADGAFLIKDVPYRSWCNSFATKSSANNLYNCLELFSCHPLFRHVIISALLLFQAYRTLECNNVEFEKVLRRATTQQPYQRHSDLGHRSSWDGGLKWRLIPAPMRRHLSICAHPCLIGYLPTSMDGDKLQSLISLGPTYDVWPVSM